MKDKIKMNPPLHATPIAPTEQMKSTAHFQELPGNLLQPSGGGTFRKHSLQYSIYPDDSQNTPEHMALKTRQCSLPTTSSSYKAGVMAQSVLNTAATTSKSVEPFIVPSENLAEKAAAMLGVESIQNVLAGPAEKAAKVLGMKEKPNRDFKRDEKPEMDITDSQEDSDYTEWSHASSNSSRLLGGPFYGRSPPINKNEMVYKPGDFDQPYRPQKPWKFSLWNFLMPLDKCLLSYFCPCVMFGRNHAYIEDIGVHRDGWANIECISYAMKSLCCQGWLASLEQRTLFRHNHELDGSALSDCFLVCFCGPCSTMQIEKEASYHLHHNKKHTEIANRELQAHQRHDLQDINCKVCATEKEAQEKLKVEDISLGHERNLKRIKQLEDWYAPRGIDPFFIVEYCQLKLVEARNSLSLPVALIPKVPSRHDSWIEALTFGLPEFAYPLPPWAKGWHMAHLPQAPYHLFPKTEDFRQWQCRSCEKGQGMMKETLKNPAQFAPVNMATSNPAIDGEHAETVLKGIGSCKCYLGLTCEGERVTKTVKWKGDKSSGHPCNCEELSRLGSCFGKYCGNALGDDCQCANFIQNSKKQVALQLKEVLERSQNLQRMRGASMERFGATSKEAESMSLASLMKNSKFLHLDLGKDICSRCGSTSGCLCNIRKGSPISCAFCGLQQLCACKSPTLTKSDSDVLGTEESKRVSIVAPPRTLPDPNVVLPSIEAVDQQDGDLVELTTPAKSDKRSKAA